MRKARYDMRQVVCVNSQCLGNSSNIAKPGYWIAYKSSAQIRFARVLGRIAETQQRDGLEDCAGWIAAITLYCELTSAGIAWVNPADVVACYDTPPRNLLAWITGQDWVKNKGDIARIIAMSQYGTTSEQFITSRNDPEKAYNARPEYVDQFILK